MASDRKLAPPRAGSRAKEELAACLFTTTNPKRVLHASAARIHLLYLRKRLSKGNNRFCSSIYIYAYTHCTHAHKAERPSRRATTPAAIGRYTRALLADSGDSTFVLTCAAAYLKLGKCVAFSALRLRVLTRGEDAGRDCARLLAAEPKGVKARFRCAQTRVDAVLTFRAKVSTAALSVEVGDPADGRRQMFGKSWWSILQTLQQRLSSRAPTRSSRNSCLRYARCVDLLNCVSLC
jgi:hypothetical protein